ncbi:TPA: hypothetical protein QDA78_003693 [Burkholderia vietnamiensis]|nr:hypothetical protein [Burkholderia vietnamiensis]
MTTTENSRADALMEALIRKIATQYCEYDAGSRTYNILRYECEADFFNCVRELLAASPVEQPAAAPIETCPVCHAKPGQWQCPKSTNNLYNAPPDAACRAAPAPSPADERVGLTAEQRESVDHAATWLDRSEDLQNKAHAERLRALLQGANHAG